MEESGTLQTWRRYHRLRNSKLVKMQRLPGDCIFQAVWERRGPVQILDHTGSVCGEIWLACLERYGWKLETCRSLRVS